MNKQNNNSDASLIFCLTMIGLVAGLIAALTVIYAVVNKIL